MPVLSEARPEILDEIIDDLQLDLGPVMSANRRRNSWAQDPGPLSRQRSFLQAIPDNNGKFSLQESRSPTPAPSVFEEAENNERVTGWLEKVQSSSNLANDGAAASSALHSDVGSRRHSKQKLSPIPASPSKIPVSKEAHTSAYLPTSKFSLQKHGPKMPDFRTKRPMSKVLSDDNDNKEIKSASNKRPFGPLVRSPRFTEAQIQAFHAQRSVKPAFAVHRDDETSESAATPAIRPKNVLRDKTNSSRIPVPRHRSNALSRRRLEKPYMLIPEPLNINKSDSKRNKLVEQTQSSLPSLPQLTSSADSFETQRMRQSPILP